MNHTIEAHIEPVEYRCLSCGHGWTGGIIQNAPLSVFVAWVRAMRCPACYVGPRKIVMSRGEAS